MLCCAQAFRSMCTQRPSQSLLQGDFSLLVSRCTCQVCLHGLFQADEALPDDLAEASLTFINAHAAAAALAGKRASACRF